MKKEKSRIPVLEKLLANGFMPKPDFISYNVVLYENGRQRVLYDKLLDLEITRYEMRVVTKIYKGMTISNTNGITKS